MELRPLAADGATVLRPQGRIDHTHADAFQQALAPYLRDCVGGAALVIDLADISYISSIGLRALMLALKQVKPEGGRLVLAGLTPLVMEVFKISRFDLLFEIFADTQTAVAAILAGRAA